MTVMQEWIEADTEPWDPVNENFDTLSHHRIFGQRQAAHSGLTWGYYGGVLLSGGSLITVADGTVTLAASQTNYVEADSSGNVSTNTGGFNPGRYALYQLTTNASAVTAVVDKRAFALPSSVSTVQYLTELLDVDVDGSQAPEEGDVLQWAGSRDWVARGRPVEIQAACSDETTALTTGAAKLTFRTPCSIRVTGVRASLSTAQTSGSILTVDVNDGGTSILSTKLTVDNGEKTSVSAATPPVISDSLLSDDAEITVDIDQIGDGTAKGLKITIIGVRLS